MFLCFNKDKYSHSMIKNMQEQTKGSDGYSLLPLMCLHSNILDVNLSSNNRDLNPEYCWYQITLAHSSAVNTNCMLFIDIPLIMGHICMCTLSVYIYKKKKKGGGGWGS